MNEDKIQYLIDRQSIRDTLLRHGALYDEGKFELMEDVWAPECERDDGAERGGKIVGVDALRKKLQKAFTQFNWTHHQLGDSFIEIDGDTANSITFVACWHEMTDGSKCWGTARYYDTLRRDGDRWLITSRKMLMTGAEGALAKHGGDWVERADPATFNL